MGNATSANRLTYSLLPYGGVNNLLAVDGVPSEDISDVAWTKTAVTAPAPNYFLEVASSAEHYIRRFFTGLPANTTNTVVIRAKDLGGRNCRVRVLDTDNVSNGFAITINPANGSVVSAAGAIGSGSDVSATITEDPEEAGQYIIALSGNAGATCTKYTVDIFSYNGTTAVFLGDITKGLYVTKIALNYGDEALSYQKVTSKYNVEQPGLPQIPYEYGDGSSDFHTLGKQYFGLKQDGNGVVNLVLFTTQLDNSTYWTPTATVSAVEANAANDSDGNPWADKFYEATTATSDRNIANNSGVPITASAAYTASFEAEDAGTGYIQIRLTNVGGTAGLCYHTVNLSSGATVNSVEV